MSNVRLYFKNQAIRDDGDFLCLTDMWRAGGADANKRPAQWLRLPGTLEFAEYLRDSIVGNSHNTLSRAESGQQGATWAHWQLAMAYAKYLSPEFHAWCNEVVRAVMQGRHPVPAMDQTAIAQIVTQSVVQALVPVMQQMIGAQIDARLAGASFGVVRPWELGALKRRLSAAADSAVRARLFKDRRAALAGLTMRVRTACGWTGTGAHLNRMPVASLPYAEREIAAIERELDRAGDSRQLSLVRNG
jgi:hypothetical protein